jgi:peptidoglycan glycosyltransferase
MVLSVFRNFFAAIANLFSPKPTQAKRKTPTKPTTVLNTVVKTVRHVAQQSVTRSVPTLQIFITRFSSSRKKYLKIKISRKLIAKVYALGGNKNAVLGKVMDAEDALIIKDNQVSKHHFSIERVTNKDNQDKYVLKYQNTTNGTFKREPFWAHLKIWENGRNYQYQPTWIRFIYWKCKKIERDITLRDGNILIIGEPEVKDANGKAVNSIVKFIHPPIWYVRLAKFLGKAILALLALYLLICWLLIKSVDDVVVDPMPSSPAPLAIFASDQKTLIAGGQATPHQEKQQLSQFPKLLVQTLIESEDQYFYWHSGINPISIISRGLEIIKLRRINAGGSTIDQQLARTLFNYEVNGKDLWGNKIPYNRSDGNKDTLDRKVREAGIAMKLNLTYRNKDKILLTFLNSVDLGYRNSGESVRGFSDASLFYFNKPVEQLSAQSPEDVARIANVVALVKAPARAYSVCDSQFQLTQEEIERLEEVRKKGKENIQLESDKVKLDFIDLTNIRDSLINIIRDRGFISADLATRAKKNTNYTLFRNKNGFCYSGDVTANKYYQFTPAFLTERIREELRRSGGITEQEERDRKGEIFDNYIIVTGLDIEKQNNAQRKLSESVQNLWNKKGVPHGALITINPKNGEIQALVGEVKSPDGKFIYDYAATEYMPPGSTFKIFFYTAALKGGLPLDQVYNCASLDYEGDSFPLSTYSSYCLNNSTIDLRTAVAKSDNIIPIRVVKDFASLDQVVKTARSMGIKSSKLTPPTPRMAYGQYRTILREMVGAYAVLANGGKYNFPHAIREVYLNTNKDKCDSSPERFTNCPRIYRYEDDVRAGQQVLSKDIADKMTDLLRGVVSNGTGSNADISAKIGKDIAGKTGTSTDSQDGWFIGYIPNEMVTGVWLGNFVHNDLIKNNPPPDQSFSSADAAMVWGNYMKICYLPKGCNK